MRCPRLVRFVPHRLAAELARDFYRRPAEWLSTIALGVIAGLVAGVVLSRAWGWPWAW